MTCVEQAGRFDACPENAFLSDFIGAQALAVALEKGLIGRLEQGPVALSELATGWNAPAQGADLLVRLLAGAGIVRVTSGQVALTDEFRPVLGRRELLRAKLDFLRLAGRDVLDHLADLLFDLPRFMEQARTFQLFRYDRAVEITPENLDFTRRWVAYTTALTRHEAPAVLPRLDLAGRRHLLDIGGNSGEFALQLCRRYPGLQATVVDLPVVCAIGKEHVKCHPEAASIRFVAADARRGDFGRGYDVVSFKSVLHDWPERDALRLVQAGVAALDPGGVIAVFERGRIEPGPGPLPFWMVANLVFAPFYRDAEFYVAALRRLGLAAVRSQRIMVDMSFHLITAVKPQ